jgi:hypothetical protein
VPTSRRVATEPTVMTATGMPPDAPPGHMRCEPHLTPPLLADSARHTCPLGASHPIHDELAFSAAYFPTKQMVQTSFDDAPVTGEYLPAPQVTQVVALVALVAPEYVPAPQVTQVVALVAPVAPEYVPAPQVTQVVAPAGEYVPAPQVTQVVALVAAVAPEYVPAQHRHASVHRHEAVCAAVLHQLPSAATRHHAPSLLSPSRCSTHSTGPVSRHTHTDTASKVRVQQEYK